MNLQRVKELLAAWEAGVAREDELAELRRLLPAVIDAAERGETAAAAFDRMGLLYRDKASEYRTNAGEVRVCKSLEAAYKWCARVLRGQAKPHA